MLRSCVAGLLVACAHPAVQTPRPVPASTDLASAASSLAIPTKCFDALVYTATASDAALAP